MPALLLLVVAGCARGCPSRRPPIHPNPNMDDQPKVEAQEASEFFHDGAAMRPPVPGTIARGELEEDDVFYTGRSFWSGFVGAVPFEVTPEVLERGRERFSIYCTPCHGAAGHGQSALLEFGGVQSADLTEERIRNLRAGRIFSVIRDGKGLMPGYRYPIPARDRWAIVAWVRELQKETGTEAAGG